MKLNKARKVVNTAQGTVRKRTYEARTGYFVAYDSLLALESATHHHKLRLSLQKQQEFCFLQLREIESKTY
jgi:DNA-binding LytR/AlgR family response regulator